MPALGCPNTYQAALHFRGGAQRWFTLGGVTSVDWERKLQDVSESKVVVTKAKASRACSRNLGQAEPWFHELSVYRAAELVWQGPLFDIAENRESITLTARDCLGWLSRRALRSDLTADTAVNAATLAQQIVGDALAPDDPNLLAYLHIVSADAPDASRSTQAFTATALAELLEVAKAGLDVYAIGRGIYVLPDRYDHTVRPYRLREEHILSDIEIHKLGSETVTSAYVYGSPPAGSPTGTPAPVGQYGGPETGYGLVENVSQSSNTVDPAALAQIASAVVGYGYPAPISVTIPANSQLSPQAPLTIHDLIPGRYLEVALSSYAIPVQTIMKLNQVAVSWTPNKPESVNASFIPTSITNLPTGGS